MRYLLGRDYWALTAEDRAEAWAWCDTVLGPALDGLAALGRSRG